MLLSISSFSSESDYHVVTVASLQWADLDLTTAKLRGGGARTAEGKEGWGAWRGKGVV